MIHTFANAKQILFKVCTPIPVAVTAFQLIKSSTELLQTKADTDEFSLAFPFPWSLC